MSSFSKNESSDQDSLFDESDFFRILFLTSSSSSSEESKKPALQESDGKCVGEVFGSALRFYPIIPGEVVNEHYQLLDGIGKGTFANVAKAYNTMFNKYIALKIIRKSETHSDREYTQYEISAMQSVTEYEKNSNEKSFFVPYLDHFMWNDYTFISMELYWGTLREAMKLTGGKGIPLTAIRFIGYQIFRGLKVLGRPELNIVHGDLKPNNIMISDLQDWSIKIGDFGSARTANEKLFLKIGNVHYRAPEISLKLGFDRSVDMWATGCVLAEVFVGRALFMNNSEMNPFLSMVQLFGMLPTKMLDDSLLTPRCFVKKPNGTYEFIPYYQKIASPVELSDKLRVDDDEGKEHVDDRDMHVNFLGMLRRIFVYDPTLRMTVEEAFDHKFITG